MAGVFKGNHRAQKDEFRKLRKLFAQDPASLSRLVRGRPRDNTTGEPRIWELAEEFMDLNLVPASDPNIPGRVHAIMMANVLILLAAQNPAIYDIVQVHRNALQAIGANPDVFLKRPDQQQMQAPPDPKVVAAQIRAQSDAERNQARAQEVQQNVQVKREGMAAHAAEAAASNTTARQVAALKHQTDMVGHHLDHASEMAGSAAEVEREQVRNQGNIAQTHTEAALRPPEPAENPFGQL
jgi:hypothetical protein